VLDLWIPPSHLSCLRPESDHHLLSADKDLPMNAEFVVMTDCWRWWWLRSLTFAAGGREEEIFLSSAFHFFLPQSRVLTFKMNESLIPRKPMLIVQSLAKIFFFFVLLSFCRQESKTAPECVHQCNVSLPSPLFSLSSVCLFGSLSAEEETCEFVIQWSSFSFSLIFLIFSHRRCLVPFRGHGLSGPRDRCVRNEGSLF
jgi:hypothetical protein